MGSPLARTGIASATHGAPGKAPFPDRTFLGWHWLRQWLCGAGRWHALAAASGSVGSPLARTGIASGCVGLAAGAHWHSQCHPRNGVALAEASAGVRAENSVPSSKNREKPLTPPRIRRATALPGCLDEAE